MIKAKCIKKIKNKQNRIIGYILEEVVESSTTGKKIGFFEDDLKEHIRNGKIQVINLTFEEKPVKEDKILNRAIVMGLKVEEINLVCEEKCYAIYNSNDTMTWYIPNHIKHLTYVDDTKDTIKNFKGHLRLMGGESLTNLDYLFYKSDLQSIDFTKFKPKQIKSLSGMFESAHVKEINISNLNIAENATKNQLFYLCHTTSIEAESLNNITINDIENNIFGDCGIPIKLNIKTYTELVKNLVKEMKEQTEGKIDLEIKKIDNENSEITFYKEGGEIACKAQLKNETCLKHLLTLYDEINYTEIMERFNNIIETIEMNRPVYYFVYKDKINEPKYIDNTSNESHTLKSFRAIKRNNCCLNNTGITVSSLDDNLRFGLYQLDTGEWTVKDIHSFKIEGYLNAILKVYREVIEKTDEEIERVIKEYKDIMRELNQQMRNLESMKEYYRAKGINIEIQGKLIADGILEDLRKIGYSDKSITIKFDDGVRYKEFKNDIQKVSEFLHKIDKVAGVSKRGDIINIFHIDMWG